MKNKTRKAFKIRLETITKNLHSAMLHHACMIRIAYLIENRNSEDKKPTDTKAMNIHNEGLTQT